MPPQPLIAVIEDEEHLAEGLIFNLRAEGYRVHHEADGDAALAWLLHSREQPAAVLLDVMLPGRDGFSIVRALREAGRYTPVLLLTARGRSEDIVEGFSAGADDYLPKPFDLTVLFARITALRRRIHWQRGPSSGENLPANIPTHPSAPSSTDSLIVGQGGLPSVGPGAEPAPSAYTCAGRTISFEDLEIRTPDKVVHLTLMEADLLRYLIERPGKIVARKEILENVWHIREDTDTRAIDNFIVRLRRYLEPNPSDPVHLLSVRGVGYRFVPDSPPASADANQLHST